MSEAKTNSAHAAPVNLSPLANVKYDLPAGLVVFLVALPLCLGIALASNAPLFAGIIAGIIGGIVIPMVSGSPLSVSGPAAGLTAIVLVGIEKLGGFQPFLLAVVIGGLLQMVLGIARLGTVAYFIPSSVIKGMLAAIGLILILKQFPHAIGYDVEREGSEAFRVTEVSDSENTFTLFLHALGRLERGALVISAVSMAIMITWEKVERLRKLTWLPSALVVVVVGTVMNLLFRNTGAPIALAQTHLVTLPPMEGMSGFFAQFTTPAFAAITNPQVYVVGLTIGIVASLETLLCIEAVDKLDPFKRGSPMDRELLAQGIGNTASGLLGGLPVTSVIVRSSANINAGARTKGAAVFHGLFLLLAVLFISRFLNLIPLACLATILLMTGYKLAKPELFKKMYKLGWDQFIPFIFTVSAILLTDLLRGILAGIVVGIVFVLRSNMRAAFTVTREGKKRVITFNKDVSFLNKATLIGVLKRMPDGSSVTIDGTAAEFIDHDIIEVIEDFQLSAKLRRIDVEMRGLKSLQKDAEAPASAHAAPVARGSGAARA
ncbi:SulP family inorganic anion transporter [Polyangium aurulentum]|uniref:SulP family inorganic anion transporter n=1 Tax=Polyangium aurulentum TaxID=2567896 RepID=UPI0010AE249B|nr:SulP family inorganic anion transporter [Polyangium aurulentum]UQA61734.1 SulP family inorganic anion transporter [Polyangium aurulentum]